jgi:hypothetical protein
MIEVTTQIGKTIYENNYTKWISSGTGQRNECIQEGRKNGYDFYVSREVECELHGRVKRAERGYLDYLTYLQTDFKHGGSDYEIITGKCRFFIDLDLPWASSYDTVERVVALILARLPAGGKVLWIGSSHKEGVKKSYHVVFNVWTRSISTQKEFFKELKNELEADGCEHHDLLSADKNGGFVVDMSVYSKNGLFRMYGQTKVGQDRLIVSCDDYSDVEFKDTLVSYVDESDIEYVGVNSDVGGSVGAPADSETVAGDVQELIELLRRTFDTNDEMYQFLKNNLRLEIKNDRIKLVTNSQEGYCMTKHMDGDHNPSIYITKQFIYSDCRSTKCQDTREKFKIATPDVICEYVVGKLPQTKVIYVPQEVTPQEASEEEGNNAPVVNGYNVELQTKHCCAFEFGEKLEVTPCERERCPYMTTIPSYVKDGIEKSTVVLSLGMGSGKTYAFAEFAKRELTRNPDLKVLIVSVRISYTNDVIADMQRYGVTFVSYQAYKRTDELRRQKRVVCQVDSIHRLDPKEKWDIVFLDEIQSFTAHFSSPQLDNAAYKAGKCEAIIRNCKKLVAACADYNDYSERSKNFLNTMRPGIIHEIKSNVASDDCDYVPVNYKKLILLIENLLEQGKKIVVAANTKGFIKKVELLMGKFPEKTFRTFTSESPYDDRVDKKELAKLDLIAYSPTVGPGVSFGFERDCVIFHFKNSIKASKMRFSFQMIKRCRQIVSKTVHFSLEGKVITNLILDREAIVQSIVEHAEDYARYQEVYCRDLKQLEPFMRFGDRCIENPYVQAWIDTELEDRRSLRDFKGIFYSMATKRGGRLCEPMEVLESKRDAEQSAGAVRVDIKYPFNDVEMIERSVYEHLKKKRKALWRSGQVLAEEQDLMLRKYDFFLKNNIPQDTSADLLEKYYASLARVTKNKLQMFRNLLTDRSVLRAWDKDSMNRTEFVRLARLDEALKLLGFESIFDRGSFHDCPTKDGYIDLRSPEVKSFMGRTCLKHYKGDIRKYVNDELARCGLSSINVRGGVKSKSVDGKRQSFAKWSLHDGSTFASHFQMMSCHLYRRKTYLQTKDYLVDKIPWKKIKEFTSGRYVLNEEFHFMEARESKKRNRGE